jgi:diacylglycerol kinase family enzyme
MDSAKTSRSQIVLAINPKSGRGGGKRVVDDLANRLANAGFDVFQSTDVEEIVRQTIQSLDGNRLRAVVSAGGDGTIGLLADRLPADVPYALLPLGTENLMAKYLGITSASAAATEALITSNRIAKLDVGQANGRLFLIMASVGFDADVVRRLHKNRTGHIRHWYYFWPIWNAIREYRYPKLDIVVDGQSLGTRPSWAFVFNVPRYAMNLQIVPEANAQDGLLDLRTFQKGNLFNGLTYVAAVIFRRHRSLRASSYRRGSSIFINSSESVPIQLDGDPGGTLPVEIRVIPNRLSIFVPESFSGRIVN